LAIECDVAIIGGGPAGSTAGSILKKYRPDLKVCIFEREKFPRDHVGESQLPLISALLYEMGVWDKVEAAGFPIKIGATYRWGSSDDLWDFEFFPAKLFKDEERPAKFEGQRRQTAFQVDRAIYDEILLDHAESLGCDVYQETGVKKIDSEDDMVTKLTLSNGEEVKAKYYLDGSGHVGALRRAVGVGITEPSSLKNVSFWDYWQNAEWAVEIGTGATRVQVMSLGWGWLWFIPLGPTRTSIGLVLPAAQYKKMGMKPEELYRKAIEEEPNIKALTENASCEGKFGSTKDWSFVADRGYGKNWMLIGESFGFADPVLAAGLCLAQYSAREAAYTILAQEAGEIDDAWLKESYANLQIQRVSQHIRFADLWYSANGKFTDLKEYTRDIAKDAGMELNAEEAFRWLGTGGFVDDGFGFSGTAGFSLFSVKEMTEMLTDEKTDLKLVTNNVFKLNIAGAEEIELPTYSDGKVTKIRAYRKGEKVLPMNWLNSVIVRILRDDSKVQRIMANVQRAAKESGIVPDTALLLQLEGIEAMIRDGWIKASYNKNRPKFDFSFIQSDLIHFNEDTEDLHV
jgi:flavin-dependent dehydrogenase